MPHLHTHSRTEKISSVLIYTLLLNLAVAFAKIFYGYKTGSISMTSDGFHSFFDGTSNIIGLAGILIASRPPDRSHPYGHRKFETLSTIAIAILIFIAGFEIIKKAYAGIVNPHTIEVTTFSFTIMAITLMINTFVMVYETRKGRELSSEFLLADALHTKTDLFISSSVVISLVAARLGFPVIDVIFSIVITLFIAHMGFTILKSATDILTDAACIDPEEIKDVVNPIRGIQGCHEIRTRGKEGAVNIDLHILVDPDITSHEAHNLAHAVEETIKRSFPSVIDVVVHTEPAIHDHCPVAPPPRKEE